ncbi:ATP-binding protein [Micromonosporaceae bacterium DT55]|uniref:ATP-binding protein n=1 Tax=Melissospora conviva TaxID=3388432 RepID=UPI003C1ED155
MTSRIALPSGLVTFVFTDIEGSTRLSRRLGADYRVLLGAHRRLLRAALAEADGAELLTEGDSFFLAFADARAALAACLAAQRSLAAYDWPDPQTPPRVRMGLHTGWAEPSGGEYVSPEVHRAARIAAAAHGGQVLCSADTARHAGPLPDGVHLLDLGLHRLRGFDERERLFQVAAEGLERDFPRPRTEDASAHNLPTEVSSFIGREAEQVELGRLLGAYRLVTVLGAGGAGKTRLAVRVAGSVVDSYPDGVWFVDIAGVTDPGLVAFAVAGVLGIRPEPGRPVAQTLVEYVAARRMLIVVDTCEAQPAACAELIAGLLAGAGGVRVLATSREALGIPGELIWRIPPLSVEPGPEGAESDAIALLLDRTAAARGGRRPAADEAADLLRVVSRLDGLPLAIELAAARLRVLSAGQLAERLDDLLGALDVGDETADTSYAASQLETVQLSARQIAAQRATRGEQRGVGHRHATMQATVTWSYRTLSPAAARLLRLLTVFAGPVQLGTVEWLLRADPVQPLSVLVDKSMLIVEPGRSGNTFRMLDPIRAYAGRLLADEGEEQAARDRHVAWSEQALRRACRGPDGLPVTLSLYALDPLADEVRAALHWTAVGGSARAGLRLAGGLEHWWRERGLAREGRLWLFRLYGRVAETGERIPQAELAAAYHLHSLLAGADGEYAEELRFSQRAEAAARLAGDAGLLAEVVAGRAAPLIDMGRHDEAEEVCREVIDWAGEQGVAADAFFAVCNLAALLWRRGALDEAAVLLGGARALEAGHPAGRGQRLLDMLLGMVALGRDDLVAAHDHLVVALRSRMNHGFHSQACDTLKALAVRCAAGGAPLVAARLFGAAHSTASALRAEPGIFGDYWRQWQSALREQLGEAAFDEAYRIGSELRIEEAVALAVAMEHPDLAGRSREVAEITEAQAVAAWSAATRTSAPILPRGAPSGPSASPTTQSHSLS